MAVGGALKVRRKDDHRKWKVVPGEDDLAKQEGTLSVTKKSGETEIMVHLLRLGSARGDRPRSTTGLSRGSRPSYSATSRTQQSIRGDGCRTERP